MEFLNQNRKKTLTRIWQLLVLSGLSLFSISEISANKKPVIEAQKPTLIDSKPTSFSGKKAGEEKTLSELKIPLCWCPAGEFMMGEGSGKVKVTLTRGYWIGKYEVTQGLWKQVMKSNPIGKDWDLVKHGAAYPIVHVSWYDARRFCRKLTEEGHQKGWLPRNWEFLLPTEAQWEYASRAGSEVDYCYGNDRSRLSEYAWYDENAWDKGEQYAHRVGQKKPNAWNLHDMHGNVWEWVLDWYTYKLPGGVDPIYTGKSSYHFIVYGKQSAVLYRGGSFCNSSYYARSALRYKLFPVGQTHHIGFRPVLVCTDQKRPAK